MNARERFHATMHFLPRDRSPIMDFGFWRETLVIWEQYGFPKGGNSDSFFGMDPQWAHVPIKTVTRQWTYSLSLHCRNATSSKRLVT